MEQIISGLDNILLSYVQAVFGAFTTPVSTMWNMMFVVFIAFYGYKVIISGRFSPHDMVMNCFKIILLLALATQWDTFFVFIYRMVTDLPSDIGGQLIQASSTTSASTPIDVNNALSQFYDRASAVSSKILDGAGWENPSLFFYFIIVLVSSVIFVGYATMLIVLAKIAVALLLAVAPVFILMLTFTNTKTLFDGWVRALLNYAFVPIFVYGLLSILLQLAELPLEKLESKSIDEPYFNTSCLMLMTAFLSTLLLGQVLNITSAVTGGISLSMLGTDGYVTRAGLGRSRDGVVWAGGKIFGGIGKGAVAGWNKTSSSRQALATALKNARNINSPTLPPT